MQNVFLSSRFFRFLIIGGINTAFNYCLYAFIVFIGFSYIIATTISLIVGLIFNFKTHGKYVFHDESNHLFYRYVISWIIIYFVNLGMLSLMVERGVNSYLAGAFLLPIIAVFSFVVLRYMVFHEKSVIK